MTDSPPTTSGLRDGAASDAVPLFDVLSAANLPTPSLVVDVAALTRNIRFAADYFSDEGIALRPHFKAHKCTELMRLQLVAGSCSGVTCATPSEAAVLASAGFEEILLANEVVDRVGLALVAEVAKVARFTICVDDITQVQLLEIAAAAVEVEIGVLIEIDVGGRRCGLDADSAELLPLAVALQEAPHLTLRGLQGYEGHAMLESDVSRRAELVRAAAAILQRERERLRSAGIQCELVSGGGTGTFDLATRTGVWNEIQAGSYVLMDARYAELGLPFENALYCCANVISRRGERFVANAGLKALSVELGLPRPASANMEVLQLSDEHAQLRTIRGRSASIGDLVLLVPEHLDPTVNLHPTLFAVAEDGTVEEWRVDGRR